MKKNSFKSRTLWIILSIAVILSMVAVAVPATPVWAAAGTWKYTLVINTTHAGGTAEFSQTQHRTVLGGTYSAKLTAVGGTKEGREGTIKIQAPAGMKLGDLTSLSWYEYCMAGGYPAHVDVVLDIDANGVKDEALAFEWGKNNHDPEDLPYDGAYGSWHQTFNDGTTGITQITDAAIAWAASGSPAYDDPNYFAGTLAEWKAGDIEPSTGVVNSDTTILYFEIEVDNYTLDTTSYIDDIAINGATYNMEPIALDKALYKFGDTVSITVKNAYVTGLGSVRVTAMSSLTDPTTIDIYCPETGAGTGIFTGSFQLGTGTGQLQANNTNTITVSYTGNYGAGIQAAVTAIATYDNVAPTVTLEAATDDDPINDSIAITATFSEGVTGFVKGDITVTPTTAAVGSFVIVSPSVYTFTVTPTVDGLVTVCIAGNKYLDLAGNANTTNTCLTRTYDGTAPTVELYAAAQNPTKASPIAVTASFSEAVVGFGLADIDVTNGTPTDLVSSADTIFTFNVTPTPNLLVTVAIAANKCKDAAGNDNTEADPSLIRTSDLIPPTVVISSDNVSSGGTTATTPVVFTATFSENVTGFALGDIAVTPTTATAGSFAAVSTTVYTFRVTPTVSGAVTVSIPASRAQDLALNNNSVSNTYTFTFSNTSPTATISAPGVTSPWKTSPIPFRVIFSADVTGFVVGDITLTNGSVATGSFSAVSARVYNFNVTPTGQGAVTVNVAAGVCIDASSRPNLAATACTIIYDTVAPTVAITCNTGVTPWLYTFTWSENITGFGIGCINVVNSLGVAAATVPPTAVPPNKVFTLLVTPPTVSGTVVTVTVTADCVTDTATNTNALATHALTYIPGSAGTSASIYLVSGWNLISLPLIPTNSATATVLAGITPAGQVINVVAYNPLGATTDLKWPNYAPAFVAAGGTPGLTAMDDTRGYLINMGAPATLVVSDTEMPVGDLAIPPAYDVSIGYNLISFKSLTAMDNADYLSPLSYRYSIWWKEAGAWKQLTKDRTDPTTPEAAADMNPGFGYWVYFNTAGQISQ
jgi:hypothetical protein